jgi:hypothetical protein
MGNKHVKAYKVLNQFKRPNPLFAKEMWTADELAAKAKRMNKIVTTTNPLFINEMWTADELVHKLMNRSITGDEFYEYIRCWLYYNQSNNNI